MAQKWHDIRRESEAEPGGTDRETLRAMLDRAGVIYTEDGLDLTVEAKAGPANEGYMGFVAVFTFDGDGSLKSVGAWE